MTDKEVITVLDQLCELRHAMHDKAMDSGPNKQAIYWGKENAFAESFDVLLRGFNKSQDGR